MPSTAKDRKDERNAKKKLSKKLKYSKAFAVIAGGSSTSSTSAARAAGATSSTKKLKRTILDDAYSRAGISGSDLAAAGKRVFEQVFFPKSEVFFEDVYQKTSCVETRGNERHHSEWVSLEEVKEILRSGKVHGDGAVMARLKNELEIKPFDSRTWENDFKKGWAVRWLNPQIEVAKLWRLCSLLEAFLEVSTGSNICLVPKGCQPYAPRFDETDAFIMQVSGKSRWTIFRPSADDTFPSLPVEPSVDFSDDDVSHLDVERQVTLNPGDSLYFSRGYVYFYKAEEKSDSLHICLNVRTNLVTWADLLERALKKAVETAKGANEELRECVPKGFCSFMGAQYMDRKDDDKRVEFELKALSLLRSKVIPAVDIDVAADDLVGALMYNRLRPAREDDDDDDFKMAREQDGENDDSQEIEESRITLKSEVELQVSNAARICVEGGMAVIRHCMKNTRLVHEIEDRGIELDLDDAPTVEAILNSKDGSFAIASLPEVLVEDGEEPEPDGGRIRVALVMLNEGILRVVKY